MLELESKLSDTDGIESTIRSFLQGLPGGWHEANQLLSIAGGHSNRTRQVFYDSQGDESAMDSYIAGLEIDRLASQMDVIASEKEVIAGLIMFMKGGLLLGHWKKFKFNTDYKPKTYISLWKAQYEFETGGMGSLPPNQVEPKTNRFNEFHRELNAAIEEIYGGMAERVDSMFDELFIYLANNCNMSNEEYSRLSEGRLQLLTQKNDDNPLQKLVKRLCENADDPKVAWNTYQGYRRNISSIGIPEKKYLYDVFHFTREKQEFNEPKFINHLKSSFGDNFIKIMSKLDLEVA